jgi:hypothetical protein
MPRLLLFFRCLLLRTLPWAPQGVGGASPETSEFDCRGQKTLHWGVLYNIGNLLKRRCRKWARMYHFDICSTSYGKKKGRESNWQFDSQPLKVENRPNPGACRWSVAHRWKSINESYKFASNLISIGGLGKELCHCKVVGPNWDNFGTPLWESRDKKPFGCKCRGEAQRILYGGRWWLPLSPGRGESSESMLPVACPSTKLLQNVN